jgi:hypothetical protein
MNESPDSVVESVLANGNISPRFNMPCGRPVASLKSRGVIFVDDTERVPDKEAVSKGFIQQVRLSGRREIEGSSLIQRISDSLTNKALLR